MTHEHRKKANKKRDGRNRYEKGRQHHHLGGKERPLKPQKGDRRHQQHNPEHVTVTLGDIVGDCGCPEGAEDKCINILCPRK